MYPAGPLFPADATTVTPLAMAVADATDVGSLWPPNGEPSDMLITSILCVGSVLLCSTTALIANDTTALEPLHPKTR
jgi:hypothetical protein